MDGEPKAERQRAEEAETVGWTAGMEEQLSIPERRVANIAGVDVRQLRSWSDQGLLIPSISTSLGPRRTIRQYRFHELVEAVIIARLREHVSLREIERLIKWLSAHGLETALRSLDLAADGRRLYWRSSPDEPWAGGKDPGQIVWQEVLDLERIRSDARQKLRDRAGTPGQVEQRRGAVGGRRVFAGTRIPVEAVQSWLQRGASTERILEAYPDLEEADVQAARDTLDVA